MRGRIIWQNLDGETDEEAVDRTLVDESSIGDVIFEITNEGEWMA